MSVAVNDKKQNRLMKLAKILFDPEITLEDPDVFSKLAERPCVIICNHSVRKNFHLLSSFDGPMVRYGLGNKNICSLMAADLMKNPAMKLVIGGCDCIPVERNAASTDWIHKCLKRLRGGSSVVIFPEGTTFKEKEVDTFKPGFALLAGLANAEVLPVVINGNYKFFSKNKLKIRVGTPVRPDFGKRTKTDYERETARFQQIVEKMYAEFKKDPTEVEKNNYSEQELVL